MVDDKLFNIVTIARIADTGNNVFEKAAANEVEGTLLQHYMKYCVMKTVLRAAQIRIQNLLHS